MAWEAKRSSPALAKHLKRGNAEYGEAGRYALAIATSRGRRARVRRRDRRLGLPPGKAGAAPRIACGDVDGDGDDDPTRSAPRRSCCATTAARSPT
jgi:hypothetical protein